jgi:hypothetical protein
MKNGGGQKLNKMWNEEITCGKAIDWKNKCKNNGQTQKKSLNGTG